MISSTAEGQLPKVPGVEPPRQIRKLSFWIFPWPHPLLPAQRKRNKKLTPHDQLGRVWAGNGEGGALGGQHPDGQGPCFCLTTAP